MEVREAKHDDIPGIMEYVTGYHESSNLADVPIRKQSLVKVIGAYS